MKNSVTKCAAFGLMLCLALSAGNSEAQTLINPNGDFGEADLGEYTPETADDLPGWNLQLAEGAVATFSIVDDPVQEGDRAFQVEMSQLGNNPWHIETVNGPFDMEPDTDYTYSIWARADQEGIVLNMTVGMHVDPWSMIGGLEEHEITDDWAEYTFEFNSGEHVTAQAPVHFGLAANADLLPATVHIDNLRIFRSDDEVVSTEETVLPERFELHANYPNPFNPSTLISYDIPQASHVTLKIFDMLGQEIVTLVDGSQPAGTHEVRFDAGDLPSGLYVYQIQAGTFTSSQSMLLVR